MKRSNVDERIPKGRRFLAGSSITAEQSTKAGQTPAIPTQEIVPVHSEKVKARDALGLQTKDEKASKRAIDKAHRHTAARVRFGMTRRDVAALLDREDVASQLPDYLVRHYRSLADGNITDADLAETLKFSELGLRVLLSDFEKEAIQRALFVGVSLKPVTNLPGNDFDRTQNEDEQHILRDIKRPGGEHDSQGRIGIVGAGYRQTKKGLKTRTLETFDLPEKVLNFHKGDLDEAATGDGPTHDDYSEDSGA